MKSNESGNSMVVLLIIGSLLILGLAVAFAIYIKNNTHISKSNIEAEVDWINGAFLMVKKSAIDKAGLLDEDFFLFAEEAEWRPHALGRKLIRKSCIYKPQGVFELRKATKRPLLLAV